MVSILMILWRAGYPGDDNGDDDVDVNDDGDDDCFDAPCVLKGLKRQRLMGTSPSPHHLSWGWWCWSSWWCGDDDDFDGAIYIFQLMQLKMMLLLLSVGQYYICFARRYLWWTVKMQNWCWLRVMSWILNKEVVLDWVTSASWRGLTPNTQIVSY